MTFIDALYMSFHITSRDNPSFGLLVLDVIFAEEQCR